MPSGPRGAKFAAMKHLAIVFAAIAASTPVLAASSDWHDAEGAQLRLVFDDIPDAQGMLRGALIIDLLPGWKTYWRDPGEAGVPPSLKTGGSSNAGDAVLHFPPPVRFADADSTSTGYKQPVSLAITLPVADPARGVSLKASVFLGVCKETCIPVQAEFELETNPDAGITETDVAMAFAALPEPAFAGFRLTAARLDGEDLVVAADLPEGTGEAELFVAGENGWYLDTPKPETGADGKPRFRIPVIERPAKPAGGEIFYTLVFGTRAVGGTFNLP